MKALHWLTWIFILVFIYSPVEGAAPPVEQVTDTYALTTKRATPTPTPRRTVTRTPKRTVTATATATATRTVIASPTPGPTRKATSAYTATHAHTATPVSGATTVAPATPTIGSTATATFTPTPAAPTRTPGAGAPYTPWPDAPLCPDTGHHHQVDVFHTLWDAVRGCHYDHEHGENPFTPEVAAMFPGYDLYALLGNVQIGSTNPSSSMENTHKHGGFKWQVDVPAPQGCVLGFEAAQTGVDAAVIQFHNFGDPAMELEGRVHSLAALLRQCRPGSDPGYVYTVQHVDYGQVVVPYQGDIMPYPNAPNPSYHNGLGPYISWDCIGQKVAPQLGACRTSRAQIINMNLNANSTWTSKSAFRVAPTGSSLVAILFRVRDLYGLFDWSDQTHPFTFINLCSSDGGATYDGSMPGCRWNNTTATVHEVAGVIPAAWDNLSSFDTDPEVGRVTGEGYTTRFGQLNVACTAPGPDCHPIKLVRAYVGSYGAELSAAKVSNPTPQDTPERDIYFCGGIVCRETSVGAVSSGWIGDDN
jgi:hypothetical protein